MPELFKVPIKGKDGYETTSGMLNAVLRAAFPETKLSVDVWRQTIDGVEFDTVGGPGWHPTFEGIQLKVSRWQFSSGVAKRSPFKRVMMKDGFIDLEAIRAKHAELAVIAKQFAERSDTIRTAESRRMKKVRELQQELKLGPYGLASGTEDKYHIEFRGLSADDVRALVLLLRSRKSDAVREEQ